MDVSLWRRSASSKKLCSLDEASTLSACRQDSTQQRRSNGEFKLRDAQEGSRSSRLELKTVSEASFKTRQLQILVNITLILMATPFGSWVTVIAVWACRLAAVAGILLTSDRAYTVEDLRTCDPGFGLVAQAGHLRAALKAFLAGDTYTGPLRMTRGSYFVMDDTLTVSYRWQEQETEVCPGLRLNMSVWQLTQLERAITDSSCIYVWIDRIALPQDEGTLQRTLLARMMAVYASSRTTLAMRSLEQDGSRYHQRAWTLQELCNAREVQIVTQDDGADEQGLMAVTEAEAREFPETREWHQNRAAACRPYWLSGLCTREIDICLTKYRNLSQLVRCKYPADKVRALYPMMFNTPCEDELEMIDLVVGVAETVSRQASSSTLPAPSRRDSQHTAADGAEDPGQQDPVPDLAMLFAAMPEEARAFVRLVRSKTTALKILQDETSSSRSWQL